MNNIESLTKKELLELLKSNPITALKELNKRRFPTIFEQLLEKCPEYKKYFALVGTSFEGYKQRLKEQEIIKKKLYNYAINMGYINITYEEFLNNSN